MSDLIDPRVQFEDGPRNEGDPVLPTYQHMANAYEYFVVSGVKYKVFMKLIPPTASQDPGAGVKGDVAPIHIFAWTSGQRYRLVTNGGELGVTGRSLGTTTAASIDASWWIQPFNTPDPATVNFDHGDEDLIPKMADHQWSSSSNVDSIHPVQLIRWLERTLPKRGDNYQHQVVQMENFGKISSKTIAISGLINNFKTIQRDTMQRDEHYGAQNPAIGTVDALDPSERRGRFRSATVRHTWSSGVPTLMGTLDHLSPGQKSHTFLNILVISAAGEPAASGVVNWECVMEEKFNYYTTLYNSRFNGPPAQTWHIGLPMTQETMNTNTTDETVGATGEDMDV